MTDRKVVPFEDEPARFLRTMASSTCVRFGTSSPHGVFGKPGFDRIGFADIPVVGLTLVAKHLPDMVPLARQEIMRCVAENELDAGALELVVHIRQGKRRKFRDVNKSSESFGKDKMGIACVMWLEITRKDLVKQFEGKLPRRYF